MLPADLLVVALRGLAFAAALQAAGVALYLQIFARELDRSRQRIRRLAILFAVAGLLLVLAYTAADPIRLTGEFGSMFDASLHALLLSSTAGFSLGTRLTGLALILVGLAVANATSRSVALAGAMLTIVSFTLIGHTAGAESRGLLAALLIAHLSAVAFWFGSFGPLLVICRLETPATVARLLERFSRMAVGIVPALALAGALMTVQLLGNWRDLLAPYGLFLITKVLLFALLLALASANRYRFVPRISRGEPTALRGLRATIQAEWWLAAATILVTAAMTALTSPATYAAG